MWIARGSTLADAGYGRISRGQARADRMRLAQAFPLLIMDEPTGSLDFGNQAIVLREVRRPRHRGLGIIHSTHDADHAFACGSAATLLHTGRVLAQGLQRRS